MAFRINRYVNSAPFKGLAAFGQAMVRRMTIKATMLFRISRYENYEPIPDWPIKDLPAQRRCWPRIGRREGAKSGGVSRGITGTRLKRSLAGIGYPAVSGFGGQAEGW